MQYQKISRKSGKIENACDVYISRAFNGSGWNLARSKWAVPIHMANLTGAALQDAYEAYVCAELNKDLPELAHQTLGCWCKSEAVCHARVLLNLVAKYCATTHPPDEESVCPSLHVERIPLYRATKRSKRPKCVKKRSPDSEKLSEIKTKQSEIETKQSEIETKQPESKAKQAELETKQSKLETKQSKLETKQPELEPESETEKQVAEKDEFEKLLSGADKAPIKFSYFIRKPMIITVNAGVDLPPCKTTDSGIEIIYQVVPSAAPFVFDTTAHLHRQTCPVAVVKGLSKKLDKWEPFYCYVARVTKHKKTERFQMILSETLSAESGNENSVKVHLGTQIGQLVATRFISKDDLIYVRDYGVSYVGPRKKIVLLTCVEKVAQY